MTNFYNARELEDMYGLLYSYSEIKRGERITYSDDAGLHHGTVLWICSPGPVAPGGPSLPVHYVVLATHTNCTEIVYHAEMVVRPG